MNTDAPQTVMVPTMHRPVPMNTRVVIAPGYVQRDAVKGTVRGIATMHVVFQYIVVLDEPIQTDQGEIGAVAVTGPSLTGEDGTQYAFSSHLEQEQYLTSLHTTAVEA